MEALYYYTARSAAGEFVRGSLQSAGIADALASLRMRALAVTSLQPADSSGGALLAVLSLSPVKRAALIGFFRCFATLLAAGVPIRRSLQVTMERCDDARLGEALRATLCEIESGAALSAAMAKRPKEFPELFTAMVRAGEAAGNLDEVLERLASLLERESAMHKRLATAMAYPAFVVVAGCALVVFLLGTIVPSFAGMYAQMHLPLPRQTAVLISLGSALQRPQSWAVAALATAGVGFFTVQLWARPAVRRSFDRLRLYAPGIGCVVRKALQARVAMTMGSLLRSGVDLVVALDIVAQVAGNQTYATSLRRLRDGVIAGQTLSGAFAGDALYEPMFCAMVAVGEESGALDALLARVAQYYEGDVEAALGTVSALAEPVMILVLGAIVGCVVAAILVPLYSLIGSIK